MDEKEEKRLQRERHKKPSHLQQLVEKTMGQGVPLGAQDDPAREKYPELWHWLSDTDVGRDRIMAPATFTVALVPNGVNITVNHRGVNQGFSVSCTNLDDLLVSIENYLTGPSPVFRSFGRGGPKIKKRPTIA